MITTRVPLMPFVDIFAFAKNIKMLFVFPYSCEWHPRGIFKNSSNSPTPLFVVNAQNPFKFRESALEKIALLEERVRTDVREAEVLKAWVRTFDATQGASRRRFFERVNCLVLLRYFCRRG